MHQVNKFTLYPTENKDVLRILEWGKGSKLNFFLNITLAAMWRIKSKESRLDVEIPIRRPISAKKKAISMGYEGKQI